MYNTWRVTENKRQGGIIMLIKIALIYINNLLIFSSFGSCNFVPKCPLYIKHRIALKPNRFLLVNLKLLIAQISLTKIHWKSWFVKAKRFAHIPFEINLLLGAFLIFSLDFFKKHYYLALIYIYFMLVLAVVVLQLLKLSTGWCL